MRIGLAKRVVAAIALGLVGCPTASSPPPETAPASAPPPPPPQDFSDERAWQHRLALQELGPRVAGSDGAARARVYLADALRELGLAVTEQHGPQTANLLATLPGSSGDLIVLVAAYDSPPGAAESPSGDDASGAALVLELGRALHVRGPEYTILLAFVEGDSLPADASATGPVGTAALVEALAAGQGLERVRMVVHFDRVAEPDLRIARDLLSSRALREEFWAAARRLGHTAVFPPAAPFEAVDGRQRAFLAAGMRRSVAIVGSQPLPGEPEPEQAESTSAATAPGPRESLAAVGAVSLDAISAISKRLAKIDRFVRSPVSSESPAPNAEAAAEPAPNAEAAAEPAPNAEAAVEPAPNAEAAAAP